MGDVLKDAGKRAALREQILRFFTAYPGLSRPSLDIESLPDDADPAYLSFIQELYADMHARNLRLYVNTAVSTSDDDLKPIAANSDGIILMNYDQHQATSDPGPVASQDWFVANLTRVLKIVPKEKIICAVGNYGYDWTLSIPNPKDRKASQAQGPQHRRSFRLRRMAARLRRRRRSRPRLRHPQSALRVHRRRQQPAPRRLVSRRRHRCSNELRAARQLGLQTFALWRLGEEDSSLWNIWDKPSNPDSLQALGAVQPGHDVDTEGDGDILRVTGLPQPGKRTVDRRHRRAGPAQEAHRR